MKRSYYTTQFVLLCFYSITFAQEKGDIELGGHLGLNLAKVSTSDYYTNTTIGYETGLSAGFSAEYYFSDAWGIKAKINYDQKGWGNGYITDSNGNSTITNFKLNYITIPIMATWHFGRTRNWYLNFGPYFGFLTGATATATGTDIKAAITSTDVGLAYGIGVKIPLSDNVQFFIEDQNQAGFVNVFKYPNNNNSSTATNTSSSLDVGVVFTLGDPHYHSSNHRRY